jgi:NADH-quinone oxidoreductase subunit C
MTQVETEITLSPLQILGDYIVATNSSVTMAILHDQLVLTVPRDNLHALMVFLKSDDKCVFQQLMDVCGADYPERLERFEVVYQLLSLKLNHRLRVKVATDEKQTVDSVVDLYSAAGWFERETFDMFGIVFKGHPDLRRILTDYGFEGHPLRKDFPLTGFVEIRYDETQKKIVSEPVKLMQAYRDFDFESPWEGMTTMQQAGDDKAVVPKFSDIHAEGKRK